MAQLPLIHEPKDYLVKIWISISYIIICKSLVFNKNDINSLFLIILVIVVYLLYSLILDFLVIFVKYFSKEINFSLIIALEMINKNYPFSFLMLYSVFNGALTQIIFILLFIF